MGSVRERTTTGDNDPELFAEEYYRHYMYCDTCGSFNLDPWIEPENHVKLESRLAWIKIGSMFFMISVILSVFTGLISIFSSLIFSGKPGLGADILIWFGLSLLLLFIFFRMESHIASKIQEMGLVCRDCNTTYKYGSPFFTDPMSNPKNFVLKDVPPPRYEAYWIRGDV